ncbi:hypothetical protein X943_000110 [Babesia divergens]|uniref:Uncharacterized protein n=1 Tax=Babesia divergens TaxID=32595 RepID=A0AAD9LGF6_BABDI|nr:hypothetical protein X943_000110 [Babesia divergens]
MSLQFLRNLNKNVTESLSILNEGLEIANGIADVNGTHLPYVLQLRPPQEKDSSSIAKCCIFQDISVQTSDCCIDGDSTASYTLEGKSRGSSSSESSNGKSKTTPSISSATGGVTVDAINSEGEDVTVSASHMSTCALGDACLLRLIDKDTYSEALKCIDEFIGNVNNAMATYSYATRNLLERQSLPVLCSVITITQVIDFIRKPNVRLCETFGDPLALSKTMLDIVASTVSVINRMLVYPEDILKDKHRKKVEAKLTTHLRINHEDCRSQVMSDNYNVVEHPIKDGNVSTSFISQERINAFDYMGNVGVLIIKDQEKERLHYTLSLLQTVGIETNFGRTLMAAAGVCLNSLEVSEKEVVDNVLQLIEKMYTHNDICWLLHQADEHKLYTVDKSDEFYINWQLCCNGICCACERPLGMYGIPESMAALPDSGWCNCIISRNDLISPNRSLIEEELMASAMHPCRLLEMALETSDMMVKSRITGLMLLMVLNSSDFLNQFIDAGCIEHLLNIIDTCHVDQFSVVNTALDELTLENKVECGGDIEKELLMCMSFLPCSIDCIMMLRHCLKTVGCKSIDVAKVVKCISRLASTMMKIWVYYNCVDHEGSREIETAPFIDVICIVIDMCITVMMQPRHRSHGTFGDYNNTMTAGNMAKLAVHNLVEAQKSADVSTLKEFLETGILEELLCAAHLLCCRTGFGYEIHRRVFDKLTRFISSAFLVYKGAPTIMGDLVSRLMKPLDSYMPALYAFVYNDIQTRDIETLKSIDITSQQQTRLKQLRIEMLGDMANVPILLHWLLTLNDNANVFPKEHFRRTLLSIVAASDLLAGNEVADAIIEYVQLQYKEALNKLGDVGAAYDMDATMRQLISPLEISTTLLEANKNDSMKTNALFENAWLMGIDILNKALKRIQQSNDSCLMENTLCIMSLLIKCLCTIGMDAVNQHVDIAPLLTLGYSLGVPLYQERMDLHLLISITRSLRDTYMCDEHKYALMLIRGVAASQYSDALVERYIPMLQSFLLISQHAYVSNALDVLLWDHTNTHSFLLSAAVHSFIMHFRQLIHSHMMVNICEDMQSYSLVHKDDIYLKASKTDDEIERMRQLHSEELAFAQDRIAKLTSQINVMANSYYLAESAMKTLREELDLVMAENLDLREQLRESVISNATAST